MGYCGICRVRLFSTAPDQTVSQHPPPRLVPEPVEGRRAARRKKRRERNAYFPATADFSAIARYFSGSLANFFTHDPQQSWTASPL